MLVNRTLVLVSAAAVVLLLPPGSHATDASPNATRPAVFKNCTNFNKRYPHGVGRRGARDKTKSGDPVRNFLRSNVIYSRAMRWNSDLDRDKDRIACEKH